MFAIGVLACDLGSSGPMMMGGDADPLGNNDDRIECEATFSLTGSLVPSVTPDPDAGCVPNGTWTVDLAVLDAGNCAEAFEWEAQYVYEVTGDNEIGFTYTYVGDPTNEDVFLKVTAAGSLCNGSFEHYTNGTKDLLNIKPTEQDFNLTGTAYFERWFEPQI